MRLAQLVVPHMATQGGGIVVNIGSVAGNVWVSPSYHRAGLADDAAYSVTPWNGMYSSSKAAFHVMTDALAMECSYLNKNIRVVLIAPGAVRSNIVNNAMSYELPPDSLFKQFTQVIHRRVAASQGDNAVTAEEFSRQIVAQVLSTNPPAYISLGGFAAVFAVAHWLPRSLVRWAMRRVWNKPNES